MQIRDGRSALYQERRAAASRRALSVRPERY